MRETTTSTFSEGLLMDLNPLITPLNCLTDCLNGTLITYNGDEFSLLTDTGNVKIAKSEITPGFIPLGMKEYGGIIYMALYNPESKQCEIGSIPSPSYDTSPKGIEADSVEINSLDYSLIKQNEDKSFAFQLLFLKLFEFEQLTLNPGDQYAIGYQITSGPDLFSKSKNPLYNVEIYAVDQDNKLHLLKDPNVLNTKSIQLSDYEYFDNSLSSVLALKISLNNIDWFESVVFESNDLLNFNFYGKNKLNLSNNTDDDLFIKGCKLEFNDKTLYLNGGDNSTDSYRALFKLDIKSNDLEKGSIVDFEITPFDQYTYLNDLKKKLSVSIGAEYTGDFKSNVFKYKYSSVNKSLRLDFNMPTIGMLDPYLYVEFYDIWSDYSIIFPIEDINPLGVNTLFIDTVNEPTTNDYVDSYGGVNKTLISDYIYDLENNSNKIYQPFISSKIRKNQLLRENNLYLVRISAIDKNNITEIKPSINEYTSVYKFLIVNENYNELYDQVNNSQILTDVDFNKTNLNNNNIDISLDLNLTTLEKGVIEESEEGGFSINTLINGNKYYYLILPSGESVASNSETLTEIYSKTNKYLLNPTIKKINNYFGKINLNNSEVINLQSYPEISDSDNSVTSGSKIELFDRNKITINLKTDRKIKANITKEAKNVNVVESLSTLWSKIYNNNNLAGFKAVLTLTSRPPSKLTSASPLLLTLNGTVDHIMFKNATALTNSFGFILDANLLNGSLRYTTGNHETIGSDWTIVLNTKNDTIIPLYNNKYKVMDILEDLMSISYNTTEKNLIYYSNLEYDELSKTVLTGELDLSVNSNIEIILNVNKIPCNSLNLFLAELKKILTDRGVNLPIDKIDYFDLGSFINNINTNLVIPELEINRGSSESIKDKLSNSRTDLVANNPEIINPVNYKNKIVFSKSGMYSDLASKFAVNYENNEPKYYYLPQKSERHCEWGISGDNNDLWVAEVDSKPLDE